MRKEYPKYIIGDLIRVEEKMSLNSKVLLNNFLKECSITAGKNKVENNIKKDILQVYDVIGNLDKIEKEDVDSFLVLLNNSNRSKWTKNEIKVYLKKFLLWNYEDLKMVKNIKGENKRGFDDQKINQNNLVTEEDVEKMQRFAVSHKEKAYLFLIFETGARPQELSNLRWGDITFEDNHADIQLFSGKTRRSRSFPVNKAMKFLWEWKQHYSFPNVNNKDFVFPSYKRKKQMTSAGFNVLLRRMGQRAGLKKDVWSYLFRHSRATELYEELPQVIVEQLMGHTNMSQVYAHISSKKTKDAMLNKIYKIEDLPQGKKHKLEKEIEGLKKILSKHDELFKFFEEYPEHHKTYMKVQKLKLVELKEMEIPEAK